MSTAQKYFFGNAKVPAEKSRFAITCNRLSSFLKEKGSLRDLGINANFDVIGKTERSSAATTTTVDLLSNMESPVEKSTSSLPEYVSLDSFCKPEDRTNKASSGEAVAATESKTAQMTVFYGGQVLVFDDVSSDKARDLILAASGGCRSSCQIQNRVQLASTSNSGCEGGGSQEQIHSEAQANGSDLPIARRASLHKFLAKRRDRTTVRAAPYQLMAVASSNHKFDLNL